MAGGEATALTVTLELLRFRARSQSMRLVRFRSPLCYLVPTIHRVMRFAVILGEDLFKQELAMEERLDAMIDRAVKRLVQAKA